MLKTNYIYKRRSNGERLLRNKPLNAEQMIKGDWELIYERRDGQIKSDKVYNKGV